MARVTESQLRNVVVESTRRLREARAPKQEPRVEVTVVPRWNPVTSRVTLRVGGAWRYVYKIYQRRAIFLALESKTTDWVDAASPEMVAAALQTWLQCTGQGDGYFVRDYRRALGPDGAPHPHLSHEDRIHVMALRALDTDGDGVIVATHKEVAAMIGRLYAANN